MYTKLDKAIVALITGILGFVAIMFNKTINVSPETIAAVVGALTPILVYFWPNAPKDT